MKVWQIVQSLQAKLRLGESADPETRHLYEELTQELKLKVLSGFETVNFAAEEDVELLSGQELTDLLF